MSSPRCFRCGRTLKNAASQEQGYGPVCWKKTLAEVEEYEAEAGWEYATDGKHRSVLVRAPTGAMSRTVSL